MAGEVQAPDLKWVNAANRGLARAWASGLLAEPTLDAAVLIDKAERLEGGALERDHSQEALRVLTDDLHDVAALNPLGRAMAHGQLVNILRQRIRAGRLWRRRPAILANTIERPVIILGQMRSGTTLTHRLLACDPRFSFTRLHETLDPSAASRLIGAWRAQMVGGVLHRLNPRLKAAHPTSAGAAEEEFGLHAFSLHGAMFEAQWHVPNYARWSEARDLAPVYREFRQLLQTLRWRRRDRVDTIQLLKAPQFMQDLPALLRQFPDARIVLLVRDPAEVMASSASLVWNQQRIQSDAADPRRIGAEWRRKTLLREERARRALEPVCKNRLLTVEFNRLRADWRREIDRVYDYLGLAPTSSTLKRMERVASAPGHREHRYSAADFGLGE
jgi:hypothetical protein